jgi:hypothetical protein
MHSTIIKEKVLSFLNDKTNVKKINALLITGNWGIGKSNLLKKEIISEIDNSQDYIYISPENLVDSSIRKLCYYKFNSFTDIKNQIFDKETTKIEKSIAVLKGLSIGAVKIKSLAKSLSKADKIVSASVESATSINDGIMSKVINNFNLNGKIIIIDELERKPKNLDLQTVFNQIFTIKEEFENVKIIVSLNKEKLKNEESNDFTIFQESLDKISDEEYLMTSSEHLIEIIELLHKDIKEKLNHEVDLFYFYNILNKKNENKIDIYNIRLFNKYKRELFDLINFIKSTKPEGFVYEESNLDQFLNTFTNNFYSNIKTEYNNEMFFVSGLFIEEYNIIKFKKYYEDNAKFYKEYDSSFRVWGDKTHPYDFRVNNILNNTEFISLLDINNNVFSDIEHLHLLFPDKIVFSESVLYDFIFKKTETISKAFNRINEYPDLYFRVQYYKNLINQIDIIINLLTNNILENGGCKINNSEILIITKNKKEEILSKAIKLKKEKQNYKYLLNFVFLDKNDILIYLWLDNKYTNYFNLLTPCLEDIDFFNEVILILEELFLKEEVPLNESLSFDVFYINMLRMIKNKFNFPKETTEYIKGKNKFNADFDYFENKVLNTGG